MVTLVNTAVPAEQFALAKTFAAHPDLSVRAEKLVANGERTVMPLLWTRNVPPDRVADAFEADPTVAEAELLAEHHGESLCEIGWVDDVRLVLRMITNAEATVLDAVGADGRWRFRLMYPGRAAFAETDAFCDAHGLDVDVRSIRDVDRRSAGRYGLTSKQRESLVAAARRGYFSVPGETTLQELSVETGVSHQALSERLRRASEALVENTLLCEVRDVSAAPMASADREPASADREPASADREPASADREPASADREPASADGE
ncbi:helix-turn-helix domain-containing protein [Candidatus Halobonum tyrrellensis]|uniref:DNA binding domain-containing protein n=1 Tax=Candidatus Halobonum tyrrellensis G22 TaxID=1324957 RepID=V4GYE2_9EURY|nr:bacterio-opsin activator domain-containing protein [Candidatus Halobonum tyrrellensis]ESP90206.1 DNA binding domain-containing protein [Candidatus Halobonum tyrrellensis G22]